MMQKSATSGHSGLYISFPLTVGNNWKFYAIGLKLDVKYSANISWITGQNVQRLQVFTILAS